MASLSKVGVGQGSCSGPFAPSRAHRGPGRSPPAVPGVDAPHLWRGGPKGRVRASGNPGFSPSSVPPASPLWRCSWQLGAILIFFPAPGPSSQSNFVFVMYRDGRRGSTRRGYPQPSCPPRAVPPGFVKKSPGRDPVCELRQGVGAGVTFGANPFRTYATPHGLPSRLPPVGCRSPIDLNECERFPVGSFADICTPLDHNILAYESFILGAAQSQNSAKYVSEINDSFWKPIVCPANLCFHFSSPK